MKKILFTIMLVLAMGSMVQAEGLSIEPMVGVSLIDGQELATLNVRISHEINNHFDLTGGLLLARGDLEYNHEAGYLGATYNQRGFYTSLGIIATYTEATTYINPQPFKGTMIADGRIDESVTEIKPYYEVGFSKKITETSSVFFSGLTYELLDESVVNVSIGATIRF